MTGVTPGRLVRLATLSLLYFVQGAPYGFQTACLPIILREAGLSFTALGAMKLLFLPWICKPLYAPLIETTRSRGWWLTSSMLALGITCLLAAFYTTPEQLVAISVLMFALNLFSAGQDVATDSLAVAILPQEELGAGNTVQVVAYKAGSVFAGGLLLWIREIAGWEGMFICFGAIYLLGVVLLRSLSLLERSSEHLPVDTKATTPQSTETALSIVRSVFAVPGTPYMVIFVCFYKLCERAEQTFSLFMVDKRVSTNQMAFWSTVMRSFSLVGSTYGGYLLSRPNISAQTVLSRYTILRTLPIIGQLAIVCVWEETAVDAAFSESNMFYMYAGFACTSLTLFCAGVITTAAFTLMMRLSQSAPSGNGTHYTVLATVEVFGKLAFASIGGGLTDTFGLRFAFCLFVLLAALCPLLVRVMPTSVTNSGSKMN